MNFTSFDEIIIRQLYVSTSTIHYSIVFISDHCFQDMSYDLGDAAKWEFLFPTLDKPLLGLPAMDEGNLDLDEEEVRLTYVPAERLGFWSADY
jgi:hypothetical protein